MQFQAILPGVPKANAGVFVRLEGLDRTFVKPVAWPVRSDVLPDSAEQNAPVHVGGPGARAWCDQFCMRYKRFSFMRCGLACREGCTRTLD